MNRTNWLVTFVLFWSMWFHWDFHLERDATGRGWRADLWCLISLSHLIYDHFLRVIGFKSLLHTFCANTRFHCLFFIGTRNAVCLRIFFFGVIIFPKDGYRLSLDFIQWVLWFDVLFSTAHQTLDLLSMASSRSVCIFNIKWWRWFWVQLLNRLRTRLDRWATRLLWSWILF